MATMIRQLEMDNFKIQRDIMPKSFTKTCEVLDLALKNRVIQKEKVLILLRNLKDKSNRIFSIYESVSQGIFL